MAPALDSRRGHEVVAGAVGIAIAADEAREIEASPGIDTIYRSTATGVNVCQMRTHLRWMKRHAQDLLGRASTAMHCKGLALFPAHRRARHRYTAMGPTPGEIRLTGDAARSVALRKLLAAALRAPVRTVARPEAGAAGAAMMAGVAQGLFDDIAAATGAWVEPLLEAPEAPDEGLAAVFDALFDAYVSTRRALGPAWRRCCRARSLGRPVRGRATPQTGLGASRWRERYGAIVSPTNCVFFLDSARAVR